MQVQLKVNGRDVSVEVAPNTLLVEAIRERLGLTGTHIGCDTAQCGAGQWSRYQILQHLGCSAQRRERNHD
jgi:xanthine dehydrogenase iron-sulfur cluster and FAD-binding subunit A